MSSYLQGGATHVDIACDPELVKLAISLTSLPVNSYSPKGILDHMLSNCTLKDEILIIFGHRIFACTLWHRNVS